MDAGSREEAAAFCVESVAPGWALYRDALLTTRRRGAESAEAQRAQRRRGAPQAGQPFPRNEPGRTFLWTRRSECSTWLPEGLLKKTRLLARGAGASTRD